MPTPLSCPKPSHREQRLWATGVTKASAETVLDWLENQGHSNCLVSYDTCEGFTVTE
jgi:hypothetical protein